MKKDGTSYFLGVRGTKVVRFNTTTSLWEDTTHTVTADKEMGWVVDSAGDLLYACNATDSLFTYNGTTFTNYASAPKGNILEIFEDKLYVAGVVAEPRTVYVSKNGAALSDFSDNVVFKPLGTDKITALENYYGFLLVFKEKSIWKVSRIYDTVLSAWIHKQEIQSGNYGAASRQSVVWVENDLWFFTSNREVRAFGFKDQQTGVMGMNESVISEPIKETLKLVPDANLPYIACHYTNRRFYLAFTQDTGSPTLNNMLYVCHNLYNNSWTKYTGRDKSKSSQIYSINGQIYSVKNVAPFAILKWDTSLNDNGTAISSIVTFKKIEDKDFYLFNIYRYIDLMFKNLYGRVKITLYSDKSDLRTSKSKTFYIGLTAEDELGSLGETPFGQVLWGDSFGEEGAVSPFIKRRLSFLSKAQTLTMKLENDELEGQFTIAQFAVYGSKTTKEMSAPSSIISTK